MIDSIGDQPIPWVQPIWDTLFGGLCEVTRRAAELWTLGPSGRLLLSFEKQVHDWTARLVCDPLVAHATKEVSMSKTTHYESLNRGLTDKMRRVDRRTSPCLQSC